MAGFLDDLPLSDEEKRKLDHLAAESPAALLSMIQANRKAFEEYFGPNKIPEILDVLEHLITPQERQILENPPPNFHKLGAVVGKNSPKIKSPNYDLEERNRLFEELQFWQSQDTTSDEVKQKINTLTNKLNELFNQEP